MSDRTDQVMPDARPVIVTYSLDDDEEFQWYSDGWYQEHQRGTPEAERLFDTACRCVEEAKDVPDAVRRLESAGFKVRRLKVS